jgi:O-antigen/teichoic acid export membrane protein
LLSKEIAKGAGTTLLGHLCGKILLFAGYVVVARILGVERFGIYAIAIVLLHISQTISRAGLSEGAIRYVALYGEVGNKGRVKGTLVGAIGLPLLLGVFLGLAFIISSHAIADLFGKPALGDVITAVAVAVPITASMMVAASATRGFRRMQYFVYTKNVFHPLTNLVLVVFLCYFLDLGASGAVFAWAIASGLALILAIWFVLRVFPEFTRVKASLNWAELLKFSCPIALAAMLNMLFMRIDIMMLGYFRPAADVGVYSGVVQVVVVLSMGLTALNSIFGPIVAAEHKAKDFHTLDELLKIAGKWVFLLTLPLFIVMVLCGKQVLAIFGDQFQAGWLALVVLCTFHFLSVSFGPVSQTLIMSGKQMHQLVNVVAGLLINIILNLILIPRFGMSGAALATGVSLLCFCMAGLLEVRYILGLWPFSRKYVKGLVAGAVATVSGLLVRTALAHTAYLVSLVAILTCILVAFLSTLLLLRLDEEDKTVLVAFKKSMMRSLAKSKLSFVG